MLVFMTLLVTGCASTTIPTPSATLSGVVQRHLGGAGQADATVTFYDDQGQRYQTETALDGSYTLQVPAGYYDGLVTARGLASSRVQNLQVDTQGRRYDFVVLPPFNERWSTAPIGLSVTGFPNQTDVTGSFQVSFVVESVLATRGLYAAVGVVPVRDYPTRPQIALGRDVDLTLTDGTLDVTPEMLAGVYGDTELEIVAYDQNNNRVHYLAPFAVTSEAVDVLLPPVRKAEVVAFTISDENRWLELQADTPRSAHVTTRSSPTILTQIRWEPYTWPEAVREAEGVAYGFRVERLGAERLGADGAQPIAMVPPDGRAAIDLGPGLLPGQAVRYRVIPFVAANQGSATEVTTTPLAPFRVTLLSPNEQALVPTAPTFRWRAEPEVGAVRYYIAEVYDTVTGANVQRVGNVTNGAQIVWDQAPLLPGRQYYWGLRLAYAADDPEEPRALSVAIDSQGAVVRAYLPGDVRGFMVGVDE